MNITGTHVVNASAVGGLILGAFTAYQGYQTANPEQMYSGIGQVVAALGVLFGHSAATASK